jgi:hypothetical protein
MSKYLGMITQLSGETGILEVVIICVKNYIACVEVWVDENCEMLTVEVKGRGPKFAWEITGIYRAPNEDMRVTERLAAQTDYLGNSAKHSITGGDWNGNCVTVARMVGEEEKGHSQNVSNESPDLQFSIFLIHIPVQQGMLHFFHVLGIQGASICQFFFIHIPTILPDYTL